MVVATVLAADIVDQCLDLAGAVKTRGLASKDAEMDQTWRLAIHVRVTTMIRTNNV